MKLLAISIHGRELVRTPVEGNQVLVGRSPVCDVVLRAPKINPVHFMLEKLDLGEGEEEWSIFIISPTEKGNEKKVADMTIGSGLILDKQPVKIGDIEFKWISDKLTETQLSGGALKDHLMSIQEKKNFTSGGVSVVPNSFLMEVISVHGDTESVNQVNHFKLRSQKASFAPLFSDPRIRVSWELQAGQDFAKIEVPQDVKIQKIISKNFDESEKKDQQKEIALSRGELVFIHKNEGDFYFRFVPQIDVPKIKYQLWSDPFYRNWLVAIAIFLLFLFWIKSQPPFVETENLKAVRVAEIKVSAPPQPPPVEVKPEVTPEPIKEEPKPIPKEPPPDSKVAEKPAEVSPKKVAAPQGPGLGKPKIGKEQASPKKVTEIGLFAGGGLFKKQSVGVKADNIKLSGTTSPLAGQTGTIVVNKSPGVELGLAGDVSKGTPIGKDLKGLKSDISFKDKAEVGQGRVGGSFKDGDLSIGFGGNGSADFPGESGDTEDVQGGLDKESIRRTLANYKRDIRTCYEKALATQSKIGGRIVYRWGISPQGKTTYIEMTKTSVIVPTLEVCVKTVIKDIKWPQASNGQSTVVIYPFQFQSKQ